jgi:putative FmdB family regulatory protein
MAEFEYKCTKCGEIVVVNVWQQSPLVCPKCDEGVCRRIITTVPSVHYNGTGFASTDIPRESGLEDYTF